MTDSEASKIVRLETKMNNIEQKVDDGFAEAKLEVAKLADKLDDFIAAADTRYAPIIAWSAIKWVIVFVFAAVGTALLAKIIQ